MQSTRTTSRCIHTAYKRAQLTFISGCEPLTPDDIAEVIVFAAGRRENVVIADTLIFPSHQVSFLHTLMYVSLLWTQLTCRM